MNSPGPAHAAPTPMPWLRLALHLASLMLLAALGQVVWVSVPAFREVFASFGVALPQLTGLLVNHTHAVAAALSASWLHQLLWLLLWMAFRTRTTYLGLLLAGALNWLLAILLVVALYLPVWSMGSVV